MICLRFSRENTLLSWIIGVFTWSEYSHVEFVTSTGYLGAAPDGVKVRPMTARKGVEFILRHIDCTYEQELKTLDFARSQIGKPYDWSGVFGVALHRDWHEQDSWFCSELVMTSLEAAGLYFLRDKVNRVTPEMILDLEEVKP